MLSMFVIFLVLFGMLELFYFIIGQFFIDYAAVRGARSHSVGFQDYLVAREIRVNALPASGRLVKPADSAGLAKEKSYINSFLGGNRWLEYEYWFGTPKEPDAKVNARLRYHVSDNMGMDHVDAAFTDYEFPYSRLKRMFFGAGIDLNGEGAIRDYAIDYLDMGGSL
jgi:hypothetical protein